MPGLASQVNTLLFADVVAITANRTAIIEVTRIVPTVGPSRVIVIRMKTDTVPAGTATEIELTLTMRDQAFEEFDLFGRSKAQPADSTRASSGTPQI